MSYYIFKIITTGVLVLVISEVAKVNSKIGGLITALPITTLLVVIWLYIEGVSDIKIISYIKNTLYFIIPTLPLFLIFPIITEKMGSLMGLILSILLLTILIYAYDFFLKKLIS